MERDGTGARAMLSKVLMSPGEPRVQRYGRRRPQPAMGPLPIRLDPRWVFVSVADPTRQAALKATAVLELLPG